MNESYHETKQTFQTFCLLNTMLLVKLLLLFPAFDVTILLESAKPASYTCLKVLDHFCI